MRQDRSVVGKKIGRDTWKRILAFAHPFRGLLGLFTLVMLASAMLAVVPPLLFKSIIDDGVLDKNAGIVVRGALIVGLVALGAFALDMAARWCSARIGEGLIHRMRTQVFDHITSMPLAFFSRSHTGKLVSRIGSDVLGAQRTFTTTFSSGVASIAQLVLVLVSMVSLSPWLTLVAVLLLPVFLIPARFVGRRLADLSRESANLNGEVSATMTERFSVSGALLVKLFGRRDEEHRLFDAKAGALKDVRVQTAMISRFFVAMMTLVAALATALIYGVGGLWALDGRLSVGTLTALAALLTMLYGPLISLSNLRVDLMSALVSFERVFEVLDLQPMIADAPDAKPVSGIASVEFDDVHFTYPDSEQISLASLEPAALPVGDTKNDEVLRGISFRVEPGKTLALVGPSGAGKTTITHLVARLYDATTGTVRIGGDDVRDVTAASLQQSLGYVTQDAHMFHDTVRANMEYAKPEATEEQMWAAMESAHIADLVRRLPQGLDTVVGERGYRLSGGERQRLAIARLLLKSPSIVVLDEATAHLDSESELAVQRALDSAMESRTSIVIAHRLSTVRAADEILVVAGGRVIERGRHAELLAAGGLYRELYETQFGED